ncbi:hypothetical protein Q0590_28550 [Rhodocytophaga aerolata]|uniref:GLPGLI family protein n=1 Tax=Rhodocytophaga aerolata TaxID=455078 RepID=A0ABT8RHI8_9BACT|nr:DUF6624 domain-containing protein [Rhodocytophaga aerolata]MDO1450265.1 hypothetical protein [Rhodocytophaga aerolata]
MKQLLVLLLFLLLASVIKAQQNLNISLKQELDSIFTLDQKYRQLDWLSNRQGKEDSIAQVYQLSTKDLPTFLHTKMQEVDASNLERIEAIFKQYGYPGKSLVGTPTNEAVFYVLQHSPKIQQYMPQIEQAAKKGELAFHLYAMMEDRFLMQAGKEQVYGSQVYGFKTTNAENGQEKWQRFVWPIKDPKYVNTRRKQAGFTMTVEENAKRLGVDYLIVTLEEVNKLQGK